jgi:hypothetical protein
MTSLTALQQTLDYGMTEVPEEQRPNYLARVAIANGALIGSSEAAKSMIGSAFKGVTSSGKTNTDLQNTIFRGLDDVKFGEDYAGKSTGSFADVGEKAKVERVVALGTPEEQLQAAEMDANGLFGLAKNIRTRYDASILSGGGGKAATTSSPRSLFSSKTVAPMATPP